MPGEPTPTESVADVVDKGLSTDVIETGQSTPPADDDVFVAVPAGIIKVSSSRINDVVAERLYAVASTTEEGASNGKVYPARTDPAFIKDSKRLRSHLASRLDPDTHRAAITVYRNGSGLSFGVQIKPRVKRAAKST